MMKLGIALYDALMSVDVSAEKAGKVVDAMEEEMQSQLATKQDLNLLKQDLIVLEQKMTSTLYRALLIQTMAMAGLMFAIVRIL
mgnify:CR=1 FL=1